MIDTVYDKEYSAFMKSAKSYKISFLIIAFVLSVVAAFCSMSTGTVKADGGPDPESYFTAVDEQGEELNDKLSFANGNLVATLSAGQSFKIDNELVVDNLAVELLVPQAVDKLSVIFETDSYYINGNKVTVDIVTTYKTEVETAFTVEFTDSGYKYYFNDNTEGAKEVTCDFSTDGDRAITINVGVAERKLSAYVSANDSNTEQVTDADENQVECVDKTTANLSFRIDALADGNDAADLKLVSVNQGTTDDYKQTFVIDDTTQELKPAYPRVTLNDDAFIKDTSTKAFTKLVMKQNVSESYTLSVYSVLDDYTSSSVWLTSGEPGAWLSLEEKPKKIAFKTTGDKTFNIVLKVGEKTIVTLNEEYKVTVIDKNATDKVAPKYDADPVALAGYNAALNKAIYKEVGEGADKQTVSISLGTEVELPSMRDLVYDEYTPYEDLTLSLNYITRTNTKQTSSELSFKVTVAGNYMYYVVFTDAAGNAMEADDFMKTNEDDNNQIDYGTYKDFIFKFNVEDNAPIDIETTSAKGVGYIGIVYKASKFKIEAEGCSTTYTLYYNENKSAGKDDDGWVKIPAASKVTSTSYEDEDGNTYDSIQAIGYDGELTFTPTKEGAYMIDCVATSEYTTRTDSAYSIVSISDKPVYVEVPNYWLRDNVWSVVFLSVGFLCLIGIVVLYFIKPKDETESD